MARSHQLSLIHISIEDSDDIRSNFSVPTKGNNGSTISWEVTGDKDIATLGEGVNDKSRTVTVKRDVYKRQPLRSPRTCGTRTAFP